LSGTDSVGLLVEAGSRIDNSGKLVLSGEDSYGARVLNGTLNNSGDLEVHGTAVYLEGASATLNNSGGAHLLATDGRAAIEVGPGANLVFGGPGSGVVEGRGSASAIRVDAGAAGLTLNQAHLVANAVGATGNGIDNVGEIAGIQLTQTVIDVGDGAGVRTATALAPNNSGTINVTGSGVGILFQQANGAASANPLDLSGSSGLTLNVSGAGGTGMLIDSTGQFKTAATVQVSHAAGGSALVLEDGVGSAINSGVLSSLSTAAPTVAVANWSAPASLTNTAAGTISAPTGHTAVSFGDQDSTLVNQGTIRGNVNLGKGNDVLNNTGLIDGDVVAGAGNNTLTVDGGTVTGDIRLTAASGNNQLLLKGGGAINTFSGSGGNDLVTIQGSGNTFTSLDGGAGSDTVVFDGAAYTLASSAAIRNVEQVDLRHSATLTLQTVLNTAAVDVDGSSTLAIRPVTPAPYTLGNLLTGNGLVTVDTGTGHAFDFAGSVGTAFAGTVAMGPGTLALAGDNTAALSHATLRSDAGSVTAVGSGEQIIGGLAFNGGTLNFGATVPDETIASSRITATTLDASGAGIVQLTVPDPYVPSTSGTLGTANLLEQDDGEIGVQLVRATSVTGSGGGLVLANQSGTPVAAVEQLDISQGGNVVAKADYGFRLTTSPGDGLYVNYGLTRLDLQAGRSLTLQQAPGATGAAADMSAQIVGSGDLVIAAGSGTVSLSSAINTYSGETTVQSGTLALAADQALGQTAVLHLLNATRAELAGYSATLGALDSQAGSTLDLGGGELDLTAGGNADGVLSGAGRLHLAGGLLTVQGANSGLSAAVAIDAGATARLDHIDGLGSGAIHTDGTLRLDGASGTLANDLGGNGVVQLDAAAVLAQGHNAGFAGTFDIAGDSSLTVASHDHLGSAAVTNAGTLVVDSADDWTLDQAVSGVGALVKQGVGTLTAGGGLSHTGATRLDAGTLIVGDAGTPAVTLGGSGAGPVTVATGATLAGLGTVSGQVVNHGTVSALNALPGHAADPAGTFTLANGLENHGNVVLAGGSVGNVLRVQGDYVGQGGTLVLATVMGNDSAATDRLLLDGGQASGDTGVVIRHAGGSGAQTNQGIRLVETVNGATTEAEAFHLDSRSDGYRSGVGSIAAGAYDYRLVRGGNGGVADDWYLVSLATATDDPGNDPGRDPGNDPVVVPDDPVLGDTPSYRPEVGAYLGNRQAAMALQFHRLHERQGQASQVVAPDGRILGEASSWGRIVGAASRADGAGNLRHRSQDTLIHLGSDLLRVSDGGQGSVRLGVMGAFG
ncbi:autotransporter-associated beta strand repeat-containing protein, partial [Chitiniphilus shinanonensis]|uniref:autotransporter-associated beta strand repeat-containing protein n=1 Tax=Chitiniphilus shinanonensis TaxID=553088 RepID=UPI0024E0460F